MLVREHIGINEHTSVSKRYTIKVHHTLYHHCMIQSERARVGKMGSDLLPLPVSNEGPFKKYYVHNNNGFLFCFFQPADKKKFPYGGLSSGRPMTPPRGANQKKGKK